MAYKDALRLKRKLATESRVKVEEETQLAVDPKELLTFREAARFLGISKQAMYGLVARGMVKTYRVTSRISRLRKSDIEEMLDTNPFVTSSEGRKKVHEEITEFYLTKEVCWRSSTSVTRGSSR